MTPTVELQPKKAAANQPKYLRLAEALRTQIQRQELQPGDRLPSFVELRARHSVTPTTVNRVYGLLESEGIIERRHGSGTYVARPKRASTGNIGFVGSDLSQESQANPFYADIAEGLHGALGRGQHLLYMGLKNSFDAASCAKVDGILVCEIEDAQVVLDQLPRELPRVSLLKAHDGLACVAADDRGGARFAVEHLVGLGHHRIACLMETSPSASRCRYAGYRQGLLEANIPIDPKWARLTPTGPPYGTDKTYLEWGRRHMRLWLDEGFRGLRCSAIFVQNEVAAIGVMQVLQQNGWSVPDDISVMGFDATRLCDLVTPRLCAMEAPLARIGAKAVEVLNRLIEGEALEAQTTLLPMRLRAGDSVGPNKPGRQIRSK